MKTAKTVISATLALVIALLCFVCCAKLPEDPVTTTAEKYSYVSPYGATAPVPDNQDEHPDATSPQFVETINNVEVVFGSYYVYGKNAAKITSVDLRDTGISYNADGFVNVELLTVGSRSQDMKIGYTAYDKDGNVKPVKIEKTKKHVPPDVTAQIFWLKNRQRDRWQDRPQDYVDQTSDNDAEVQIYLPDNGRDD